jgi:hypothetical protein
MRRTPLFAALASILLVAGCADTGGYNNRTYVGDGWGYRPYRYGYPSRAYDWRDYDRSSRRYAYNRSADDYYRDRGRDRDEGRRLVRPERDVVCDRRTEVCYKDGDIDASETRERFGRDASRKVERVRDRYDNKDLFLPRRNIVCNDDNNTCYRNGKADRSLTREYFGRRAARRLMTDMIRRLPLVLS